jgi:hypothetical protein
MKKTQKTAKYPKYDDNILEGTKSTETKQVLKYNANRPVTTRQNPILEPKENAIQISSNLIYSIGIPRKQQISVYRLFYYV